MLFLEEDKRGLVWGIIGYPALILLVIAIIIFGVLIIVGTPNVTNITSFDEDLNCKYIVNFLMSDAKVDSEEIEMIGFVEKWYKGKDEYGNKFWSEINEFLKFMPNSEFANLRIFHSEEKIFERITDKLSLFEKEKFTFKVPLSDGTILDFVFYRYGGWLD